MNNSFIGLVHDFMQGNDNIKYMDDVFEEHNLSRCEGKFPVFFIAASKRDFILDEYDFAEDEIDNLKPWECIRTYNYGFEDNDDYDIMIRTSIHQSEINKKEFHTKHEANAFIQGLEARYIDEYMVWGLGEEEFNDKFLAIVKKVNLTHEFGGECLKYLLKSKEKTS